MVGAGEDPGPVNDIVNPGRNAGRQALALLHRKDRFNQALALGQQLDELLIDNVDVLAEVGDTWLFHCRIHVVHIR
jgi:hypothetical protein